MGKNLLSLKVNYLPFLIGFLLTRNICFSQVTPVAYPQITAYTGTVHPLITFSKNGTTTNFNNSYTMGFPTGINIWKSAKVGFSFEVVPSITAANGTSKMDNLLFHPGILLSMKNGFGFAGRIAFETAGRYGFTTVFGKTVKQNKNSNFFMAVPFPVRFGNNQPASLTIGLQ